jgi:K+-transporting ATPase ATPase C chain
MNTIHSMIDDRVPLRAPAAAMLVVLLCCGLLYSLAGTALGRVLFPHEASGSMVEHEGRPIGSALISQPFGDARYFQPRPSAANHDPMAAAGSNAARSNVDLRTRIAEAQAAVAAREGIAPARVPGELVTASGGGLDPHLSPTAARVQVARVARARGLDVAEVAGLLAAATEAPQFGLLGQPRVNVLLLNIALDERQRKR